MPTSRPFVCRFTSLSPLDLETFQPTGGEEICTFDDRLSWFKSEIISEQLFLGRSGFNFTTWSHASCHRVAPAPSVEMALSTSETGSIFIVPFPNMQIIYKLRITDQEVW